MTDRVSANPGRVLITPEDGTEPFYATLALADNPAVEGDKLDKSTLLKDSTAALYGLSNTAVPDQVLAAARPGLWSTWKLQYSRTTAGSFTWTAPDLFHGKTYKIGVLVVGGGGSGGAVAGSSTYGVTASGGASGHLISFLMTVSPGSAYSGVVGAGGSAVTANGTTSYGSINGVTGNTGGSSSFNGKSAEGGKGGNFGSDSCFGASGGQNSVMFKAATDNYPNTYGAGINPFGGRLVNGKKGYNYVLQVSDDCDTNCFNPFECCPILAAGGYAFAGSSTTTGAGGMNTVTNNYEGGSGASTSSASSVSATAGATGTGAGGGGAANRCSNTNYTAKSGAGACGYVKIYVQGGEV